MNRASGFLCLLLGLAVQFATPRSAISIQPSSLQGATRFETANSEGLVVVEVQSGSLAERAGLQAGDRLFEGRYEAGEIVPILIRLRTPFDLDDLLTEWAPRGETWILGRRDAEARSWLLPRGVASDGFGAWIVPTPVFDQVPWSAYEVAAPQEILTEMRALGSRLRFSGQRHLSAWVLSQGALLAQFRGWKREAEDCIQEVLSSALQAKNSRSVASLYKFLGLAHAGRSQPALAEMRFREALHEPWLSQSAPLSQAGLQVELAESLRLQGDFLGAKESLHLALPVIASNASQSELQLRSWLVQGELLTESGRLDEARTLLRNAVALSERIDPTSREMAQSLIRLGQIDHFRGEYDLAEKGLRRAIDLELRRGYPTTQLGYAYSCLAYLYRSTRNTDESDLLYMKALRTYESLEGCDLDRIQTLAVILQSLVLRKDVRAASSLFDRLLLETSRAHFDRPVREGSILFRLSSLAWALGRHPLGLSLAEKARDSFAKSSPDSPNLQAAIELLARLQIESGRYTEARRNLRLAERNLTNSGVGNPVLAEIWLMFGQLDQAQGRGADAQRSLEKSVAFAQQGGSSSLLAEALYQLGKQERAIGHRTMGTKDSCRAAEISARLRGETNLDLLSGVLSSSVLVDPNYCAEALLAIAKDEDAFAALESTRARSFLGDLSERAIGGSSIPEGLLRREREISTSYDLTWGDLRRLTSVGDKASAMSLNMKLRELEVERFQVVQEIRAASPRLAALRYPQPLDLQRTRVVLDPGTVLLTYAISKEEAHLFAVKPSPSTDKGFRVFKLLTSEATLRIQITRFRKLLADPRSSKVEIDRLSRSLYDRLLRPAESSFRGAKRLLIVADGPLHSLPFSSLRRGARYLVEDYPIHSVLSATLFGEIKKTRRPEPIDGAQVVAFGDPKYSPTPERMAENPETPIRGLVQGNPKLAPLPGTAREVEEIARIFPSTQVFLGDRATEAEVRKVGSDVRILHFATHAILDDDRPMDSALALSIPEHPLPGQENGLLQAWEIFEQMRIDADLVTLSACNTALGKEMGGEGLVGLTRAFQFAGTRSVLASLWAIGDGSTSRFMPRFYEHLRDGLTKDEALRQTQIEWLRNPRTAHPYYWAAFQLIGDYR